jgi:hypothetical protein
LARRTAHGHASDQLFLFGDPSVQVGKAALAILRHIPETSSVQDWFLRGKGALVG